MPRFLRLFPIVVALALSAACGNEDTGDGSREPRGNSGAGSGGAAGSGGTSQAGTGGGAGTGGAPATGGSSGTSATGGASGSTGGSAGSGATSGTGGGAGASGSAGGANTPYPAGPYGREVGNTIDNYQFTGYVNPTGAVVSNTLMVTDYSLDTMRKSGARYALIHLSAINCSGCRSAAGDLGRTSAPVQQAGGLILEDLFDGDMNVWITTYQLKVTTVAPKPGNTLVTGVADREHAMIVDLSNMKIIWKAFGSYATTNNSSAKQGLAEMSRLLGI